MGMMVVNGVEVKTYCYGMRSRGFSIGCQPSGVLHRFDDETGKYFDLIVYGRQLTDEELDHYSLDEVVFDVWAHGWLKVR